MLSRPLVHFPTAHQPDPPIHPPQTPSNTISSHPAQIEPNLNLYHPKPIRPSHHRMTWSPPPAPLLKTVDLPHTPTPGEWIRAERRKVNNHKPSDLDHVRHVQQSSEGSYTALHSHGNWMGTSEYEPTSAPVCPASPWSIDSGIEVTPPRPSRLQKLPQSALTPTNIADHGHGRSTDRYTQEEEENEDEGMVSYVQPDQRTIHAIFGSGAVGHVGGMIPYGRNKEAFHREEVTVDLGRGTGYPRRAQVNDEGVQEEEGVWVEVTRWCPGGDGCQEHQHGDLPLSNRAESTQGKVGFQRSGRSWNEYGEAVISFPDVIIEPSHPGLYPEPFHYSEEQHPAILVKPYHPSIYPPQQINTSGPLPFPPNSWYINTQPLPIHPLALILLHSPFRPPRWMTYSAFLSLDEHYSQPDPMLGRKGCWKCSLCGTGSRIPLGAEEEVKRRAVELSELGLRDDGNLLRAAVRPGEGGFEMDRQEQSEFPAAVDIFVRRGRARGRPRTKGNLSATRYLSINDQNNGTEALISTNAHSESPLYSRPEPARNRDRRISMQVEPYRRVRESIVPDADLLRHEPYKEI